MATERQIAANQANSSRSTGPRDTTRTRFNATRHDLASESIGVEAGRSPEFAERRAKWAAIHSPEGDDANWALDKAVAASLRIDRCECAVDELVASGRQRARLAWDQDRQVEAATIFGRLARDPVLASRQLRASFAGVALLAEAWLGLIAALEGGEDWSEAEASRALDLLGVAADLRAHRTLIDAPGGIDPVAFRLGLAQDEVDRLEGLANTVLAPLDEMDRKLATSGDVAMVSKPVQLVLRYERDAWRRYREAMKEVKALAPEPIVPLPRKPVPVPAKAAQPAPTAPSRSVEEERRALLAKAAPLRKMVVDRLIAEGFKDEDAQIAELERRIAASPFAATERSHFVDFAVGRSS